MAFGSIFSEFPEYVGHSCEVRRPGVGFRAAAFPRPLGESQAQMREGFGEATL